MNGDPEPIPSPDRNQDHPPDLVQGEPPSPAPVIECGTVPAVMTAPEVCRAFRLSRQRVHKAVKDGLLAARFVEVKVLRPVFNVDDVRHYLTVLPKNVKRKAHE